MAVNEEPVLVTGAAGFIGFHVARRLLGLGRRVVGVDIMSSYYDVGLKEARLAELTKLDGFEFVRNDLSDRVFTQSLFEKTGFSRVVHLAAQPGVRHSLVDPHAYIDANIQGFLNILEGCRRSGCGHLVYASSSSVYGANKKMPFSLQDNADHPLSLYGATKKANELMAHAYSHLFDLPTTGLRFFTVYGPWGRPDMAVWLFTESIASGKPIKVFNHGQMLRDFTYIDDVIESIVRLIDHVPSKNANPQAVTPDPSASSAPWRVYNIGNNKPVEVTYLISLIEKALGREAKMEMLPMQDGDVPATFADVDDLMREVGFSPSTPIEKGISDFVAWFRAYKAK